MVVDTPHVILAVLGDQWLDATPLFRFLAASGIATGIRLSTAWSYLSEGRTGRQLRWECISSPVLILAIVIGLQWGVVGVAIGYAAAAWALVVPAAWFCAAGSRLRLSDFFAAWWRPAVAAATAGLLLFATAPEMARQVPPGTTELGALRVVSWRGPVFLAAYSVFWLGLPGGRARLAELNQILTHLRPGSGARV